MKICTYMTLDTLNCITADSNREELSTAFGSPETRRSSGDVGGKSQVHSSRDVCRCDCFGPSLEIEISEFAVQFSFGIKLLLPSFRSKQFNETKAEKSSNTNFMTARAPYAPTDA